jgi:hypothetical protein
MFVSFYDFFSIFFVFYICPLTDSFIKHIVFIMKETESFSRLVSEMTLEERNNLREKILAQSNISKDPLYEDEESNSPIDTEDRFTQLPWYWHLWFFILSLFKTINPVQLFEERQLTKLGKKIHASFPDVFDYKSNMLLPFFYQTLVDMRDGARFFYTALDASVNRDKGAFYAFLGSLEMEEIHRRLETQTDPAIISNKQPDIKESEIRKIAFHEMNEALATITEEQRNIMYQHARSLDCLKELASFRYDRLLLTFTQDPKLQGYVSSAVAMKEPLETLNNILHSFKDPPSMAMLESLFVFFLREGEDEGSNIDMEMRELLVKAENALVAIRTFNKEIPLILILRCIAKNISLSPQVISGGEDWYVIYHDYWRNHLEERLYEYRMQRRQQELFESFRSFLKGKNLKFLEHAASEANPDGLPIKGTFSLSFLLTFYSVVFINDINNDLRHILIDGRFFQRESRTAFTESYNNLIKLESDIKRLDNQLAISGDYGKRYIRASEEPSLQARRRKTQIVLDDASDEARAIIDQTKPAITNMIAILGSIITTDGDGNYTILVNMSHFLGKDETSDVSGPTAKGIAFINSINEIIEKLQITLQILEDIVILDLDD